MRIEEKITTFAINEAGWIVWLLIGLSMGVTVGLARAVSLVLDSRALRSARARVVGLLDRRRRPARLTHAGQSQVSVPSRRLCGA